MLIMMLKIEERTKADTVVTGNERNQYLGFRRVSAIVAKAATSSSMELTFTLTDGGRKFRSGERICVEEHMCKKIADKICN